MELFATAGDALTQTLVYFAEAGGGEGGGQEGGLVINLFWIIVAAANFLLFLAIMYLVAFKGIGKTLDERRTRIEQGLRDADAARVARESAEQERVALLTDARREANDIVSRAQRSADETREREATATREELERLRTQAVAEIDAERQRALTDVRAVVADLALQAASRVVGETMTNDRERRIVNDFLTQVGRPGATQSGAPQA